MQDKVIYHLTYKESIELITDIIIKVQKINLNLYSRQMQHSK